METYINTLSRNGFVLADQLKDFGEKMPSVHYTFKKRGKIHEYIMLISYEGNFCEAVYELFDCEKNTRKPKTYPLYATLFRTLEDVDKISSKTDVEVEEEVDRLNAALIEKKKHESVSRKNK